MNSLQCKLSFDSNNQNSRSKNLFQKKYKRGHKLQIMEEFFGRFLSVTKFSRWPTWAEDPLFIKASGFFNKAHKMVMSDMAPLKPVWRCNKLTATLRFAARLRWTIPQKNIFNLFQLGKLSALIFQNIRSRMSSFWAHFRKLFSERNRIVFCCWMPGK